MLGIKLRRSFFLFIFFTFIHPTAYAQKQSNEIVTAQAIHDACKNYFYIVEATSPEEEAIRTKRFNFKETVSIGRCVGFFDGYLGFYEMLTYKAKANLDAMLRYCQPTNVTHDQLAKIFMAYVDKHPEANHLPASHVVSDASALAFPCKKISHAKGF